MSIEAVSLVLNHSKATGRTKLVLIGIANHLGDQGAWPSIATLARYANASERSVKRDIQELVSLGELQVQLNAAPINNQYKTNLYWITIEPGVTDWVSRGAKSSTSGVPTHGTETIIKNHKESKRIAQRITSDFKPSETTWHQMQTRYPNLELNSTLEQFIDYWLGAPRGAKLDWDATFRNWCRITAERKKSTRVTRQDENKAAIQRFLSNSEDKWG